MGLEERIFGTECEYALFLQPATHPSGTHPSAEERKTKWLGPEGLLEHLKELSALLVVALKDRGRPMAGEFLENGGRFYIDRGGHPEYATPECKSVKDLVAHEKAGDRIVQELVEAARVLMAERNISGTLYVFKNNIDLHGNSYGSHENYLVTPRVMEQVENLVPFLVSRQIFTGAGAILTGTDWTGTGAGHAPFGLSQRADYIDRVFSDRTSQTRGIINTRKREIPKKGQNIRLHVILGDSNLSEYALGLKLGTTALVLRLIEEGALEGVPRFARPVEALKRISHSLASAHEVEGGGAAYTALEMQYLYLERARRFFSSREPGPEEKEALLLWEQILAGLSNLRLDHRSGLLEDDPDEVKRKIDWVLKLWLLNRAREQKGVGWHDSGLKLLDIRYHDLDPRTGLFERCQSLHMTDRMVDEEKIQLAWTVPPADTRAWTRGLIIRESRSRNLEVIAENWESMKLVARKASSKPVHFFERHQQMVKGLKISLKDPFRSSEDALMDRIRKFIELSNGG